MFSISCLGRKHERDQVRQTAPGREGGVAEVAAVICATTPFGGQRIRENGATDKSERERTREAND